MILKIVITTRWFIVFLALLFIYIVALVLSGKEKRTFVDFIVTPKENLATSTTELTTVANTAAENEIRLAVVLSLAKTTEHIAEFHLLYDSWRFIHNFSPLSEGVIVDLIVFCEQPSCSQLPSSCVPLSYKRNDRKISSCFYEQLDPEIVTEWTDYLYMTSIAFMLTKPYQEATVGYQWVLRVDQDAVLSPGLFYGIKGKHPVALYDMQFGDTGHGIDFTHDRLRKIAQKLGYNHGSVHNLCSTWLVTPEDSIQLANLTRRIGKHFLANEFGKNVSGIEDLPDIGDWPKWWRLVTSLYAADIAINHFYFLKLGSQHGSTAIDHSADSTESVWDAWHIHCFHNPDYFSKFSHRDELRQFLSVPQTERIETKTNITVTQTILKDLIAEYDILRANDGNFDIKRIRKVTARDYVMALAWQKAYSGTGAINL